MRQIIIRNFFCKQKRKETKQINDVITKFKIFIQVHTQATLMLTQKGQSDFEIHYNKNVWEVWQIIRLRFQLT